MSLFFLIIFLLVACSNSDYDPLIELKDCSDEIIDLDTEKTTNYQFDDMSLLEIKSSCDSGQSSILQGQDYISLDDSEYPYVGLPRIVIETRNNKKIKDRETEIPARLQVFGEKAPESRVMNLSIRGRGNDTWTYSKKPYAIKFEKKESFLGMPEAKKWVLLANYRDRTLIRNAVAFELARKTSLAWTSSGKFAEVFLNGVFLGCYFVCEKNEVKKNRLDIHDGGYLLEFDMYYDSEYKFRTAVNNLPVNIKYPKTVDSLSLGIIQKFIDSVEVSLLRDEMNVEYVKYIDQESFADFFIVYAMANNGAPMGPKSLFMHKDGDGKLMAGPVWDFDWATFDITKNGLTNWDSAVFKKMLQKKSFKNVLKTRWEIDKPRFEEIFYFIDSLENYIFSSNQRNAELWPINLKAGIVGDEDKTSNEAFDMLKKDIRKRIDELDSLIAQLD